MGQRLELQAILESLLGSDRVYFQPPETKKLDYPCIVYRRDFARTEFANNKPYKHTKRYMVTFMDRDPDSPVPDRIAALPMCVFNRHYTMDRLNHDVYNLFF